MFDGARPAPAGVTSLMHKGHPMRLHPREVLGCLDAAAELVPVHIIDYPADKLARWLWEHAFGRPQPERIALKTAALRIVSLMKGIER